MYASAGPGGCSGSTATASPEARTWLAYPEPVKEVRRIVRDRIILPYCWDLILARHESIQASATLENAFNKVKRNLIRLVHPDKISSIKGEGVDVEVVKKGF